MKTAKELKLLKEVAASLGDTSAQLRKQRVFVWSSRILGWFGICGATFLVLESAISPFAGTVIAAFSGVAGGFAIFWSMALNQWEVMKLHIDEESLNSRIKEIET